MTTNAWLRIIRMMFLGILTTTIAMRAVTLLLLLETMWNSTRDGFNYSLYTMGHSIWDSVLEIKNGNMYKQIYFS